MLTCVFENGGKVSLRHVVVGAIAVKGNQILLAKRSHSFSEGGKWAHPGGYLNRDESTSQAVLRELLEETGYQGEIVKLFRISDNPDRPKENRQNVDFVYIVNIKDKVGEHDHEILEVKFFNLDKLPSFEEFAFDHGKNVELYKKYLTKPFPLPVIGKP